MEASTYYKLNAVLKELQSERNQLQAQIDENNVEIYETQSLALELLGKEEDDFKFFSPRKMKDIHRDELKQFDEKKREYVNRNKELIVQRDKLDSIIDVLVKVSEESAEKFIPMNVKIENDSDNEDIVNDTNNDIDNNKIGDGLDDEIKNHVIDDLSDLKHKIELSDKFIRQDPMRTKQELSIVVEKLNGIIDNLKESALRLKK